MSDSERFLRKVDKQPSGCWLWTGAQFKDGYGSFGMKRIRKTLRAHRFSYELHVGPIPDGLCVLHTCDVRTCVNPAHLWVGTKKQNTHDMVAKGRHGSTRKPEAFPRGSDHYKSKLTPEQRTQIPLLRAEGVRMTALAERFGVSLATIKRTVRAARESQNDSAHACQGRQEP